MARKPRRWIEQLPVRTKERAHASLLDEMGIEAYVASRWFGMTEKQLAHDARFNYGQRVSVPVLPEVHGRAVVEG